MTRPSDMDGEQDDFGAEDGTDAFLKNFLPNDADAEKKPSEKGKDDDSKPTPEADDEDEAAEKPAESDDEGEEETPQRKYAEDDDATYVKVKVGEEEHEVSVKDLKRLWGQESALTQKSQQVAEARKAVETEQQRYITGTAAMLDRAKARYEPYSLKSFPLKSTRPYATKRKLRMTTSRSSTRKSTDLLSRSAPRRRLTSLSKPRPPSRRSRAIPRTVASKAGVRSCTTTFARTAWPKASNRRR
jgi:hypothetical protein